MSKQNKLVYGVGTNDADYPVKPRVNGKQQHCPIYVTWVNMLRRCYSPAEHARQPTYIGCSVAPEWHSFMAFRAWMVEQDWQGRHLDKDILVPGNKVYAPNTCLFVSQAINCLINDYGDGRGRHPLGVSWHKRDQRFRAQCGLDGKNRYLGLYDTADEAHAAWQQAKLAAINDAWLLEPDPVICRALVDVAGRLLDDINASRETVALGKP